MKRYSKNSFESDFLKCKREWQQWIGFEGFVEDEQVNCFYSLFVLLIYERYLKQKEEKGIEPKAANHWEGDENDFTILSENTSFEKQFKFFIFTSFQIFVLITFLIAGSLDDVYGFSDIVSALYLLGGVYYICNQKALWVNKAKILTVLIAFNFIILLTFNFYQAPFIMCPVDFPENRFYIDRAECLEI
jgi:hypothetical protein